MATELYLYDSVNQWSAEALIEKIESSRDDEVVVRVNTPGGSVFAGWGIIAKMREHGNVTIKVDGTAMSMGAFMLAFADKVEALDVSKIMIHRASMYVSNPEQQAFLDGVNKDLRAKFTKKINDEKLRELKGVGIKEIFEAENRMDVFLTAKEAKQIGLVDKIVTYTPEEAKAFSERLFNVAATGNSNTVEESNSKNQKSNKMTLEELKANHPSLYAQAVAEGKEQGIAEQKEITAAWNEFADVDPEAVKKGIESGVAPTQKEVIAFLRKENTPTAEATQEEQEEAAAEVEALEEGAAEPTSTEAPATEVEAENKELAELEAAVDAELGIEKK